MSGSAQEPRREAVTPAQVKATIQRYAKEVGADGYKVMAIARDDPVSRMVDLILIPFHADASDAEVAAINRKVDTLLGQGFQLLGFGDGMHVRAQAKSSLDPNAIQFPG